MGSGPRYLLSVDDEASLSVEDPNHPRIQRSDATKLAINEITSLYRPRYDGSLLSPFKSPTFMKDLVRRINDNHLSGCATHKLTRRNLWRIYFRLRFGSLKYVKTQDMSLSHRGLYIQTRHNQADEPIVDEQKRKRSLCKNPIGDDYALLREVVTINQSGSNRLIYLSKNLHSRYHGSIDTTEIPIKGVLYDFAGIEHKTLSKAATGRSGVARHNDICVAFSNSSLFSKLDYDLHRKGHIVGLHGLQAILLSHIIVHGEVTDVIRCNGTINQNLPSVNKRLRWGFGRVQPARYSLNWDLHGEPMPGANVGHFMCMPSNLRKMMHILFETATKITKKWHKDSFANAERNQTCAGLLNSAMGYPTSHALFEYYEIVVTRNTILRKHCDQKNDHRRGYNLCCVYSFYAIHEKEEYKVSIIMTTRTTIGAALEKSTERKIRAGKA